MKLGISTYCLRHLLMAGTTTVPEAIRWMAGLGIDHVEIVPRGFELVGNDTLVDEIRHCAESEGLVISNYADGSNFLKEGGSEAYKRELTKVKRNVDIACRLGARYMRHDVAYRPLLEPTPSWIGQELPLLADACRQIADYAAPLGVVTSIENHGIYVQRSDRVLQLIREVNVTNFKTVVDTGNFLAVDEDPLSGVQRLLPYASVVHLKDLYCRPASRNPGEHWNKTVSRKYIRGAIFGYGDIDMYDVLGFIKHSGFDGFLTLECNGLEDPLMAVKTGLDNVKRIWSEV
jgi:sugar phosphate isomerase/epimerase